MYVQHENKAHNGLARGGESIFLRCSLPAWRGGAGGRGEGGSGSPRGPAAGNKTVAGRLETLPGLVSQRADHGWVSLDVQTQGLASAQRLNTVRSAYILSCTISQLEQLLNYLTATLYNFLSLNKLSVNTFGRS